jgi:hypothetical protein
MPVMVVKAEKNDSTIGTRGHVEALANPVIVVSGRPRPRIYYSQRR